MQLSLLNLLMLVSKRTLQIFIIQLLAMQLVAASESKGQLLEEVRLNIQVDDARLEQLFKEIEKQTDFMFGYDKKILKGPERFTFRSSNQDMKSLLLEVADKAHLKFKRIDNHILVLRDKEESVIDKIELILTKPLEGQVIDAETNEPLIGATVQVKGSQIGTITDIEGNFNISVPDDAEILIVSFVGYAPYEVSIGNQSTLQVTLNRNTKSLDEVVVTALGITRQEESLGYATQTVKENAVTDARSPNWVNSLSGKVAGLNIQGTGAGPIGSSRITLRGESSLNLENNQALIVLDGVPINSNIVGTGYDSHLDADSPVDFGSTLSDLNPDDIESISVLKGAGATALYGSRAANGALIITTKSGARRGKGIGVTVNSNFSFEEVNRWPDYQFEYGEGRTSAYYSYGDSEDGVNTAARVAAGRAWGPRFNGQQYFQYNPDSPDGIATERTPWVGHDDYISGFFRTGTTATNSVAIEGGGENGSARFSVTHLKNKWILPNTGFERVNASLSVNQKVSERLKISGKANYINKKSDNLPSAGYNNQTIMYFLIIGTAPSIRPEWFKPYWEPGLEGVQQKSPFNPGPDNPYLMLYEMLNKIDKHGFIGNASADYKINDKLNFMVRSGMDMSYEFRSQQRPFSMTRYPRGMYREQDVFRLESNTDFLLTYADRINDKVGLTISAGGNALIQKYNFVGKYADQLAQPGIYQVSNSLDQAVVDPLRTERRINSFYAISQLSFLNESIFLDITGRNDWSSTLPFENNSFFYPSASASFLLSELIDLPSQVSFAKLRLSYSQVGNDTRPYQTEKYYDKIYGNNFTNPGTLFNPDLKPEITTSYEAGIDFRFFFNRLGIDLTVYDNDSKNQILAIPLDPVSGYSNALINAGLINSRGVEVVLSGKPVVREAFKWNTSLVWSANRSYVKELVEGLNSQVIYAFNDNVSIEARVGGRMGDLYGRGFQRSPDGEIIYNSNGLPAQLDPETRKFGNAFPDWKGSITNEFSYKNINLSILLDGQMGGSVYSMTNHKNNTLGKTKVTLPGRETGIVGDGVVLQNDGTFVKNTTTVGADSYYNNYYGISNAETNIFSSDFLKIREIRVTYKVNPNLVSKLGFQMATVALYGRDLFTFSDFPGFDPEGGNLNNGTPTPGVEITQFPSTRSIGANITLKF
jgi:TonB-linked SusC/RagA family outer membrane protein